MDRLPSKIMFDKRSNMDRLPSSIIFNIFSRLSGTCLARSRCVSKVWCEYIDDHPYLTIVYDDRVKHEPIPILYHTHRVEHNIRKSINSLCFHMIESEQTESGTTHHTYLLEPKEDPLLDLLCKKPLTTSSDVITEFRGSCNGLMCLSQSEDVIVTSLVVVHPLRKECYELPSLLMCRNDTIFGESCGLGFDASTNTFKMVCVLFKEYPRQNYDLMRESVLRIDRKDMCTMVHVIGTNSWREIPQVPAYPIKGEAVFANGLLHWLVNGDVYTKDGASPVIWFDVAKEEFGLIDPPKRQGDVWREIFLECDHLVDLNGEVGYVSMMNMCVWVWKQKEWVPVWQFVFDCYVEVVGCWNKDGDMLVRTYLDGWCSFFVYNLKSGVLHKTRLNVPYELPDAKIFLHPNKLFSIHGIGKNSFPIRRADVKERCNYVELFCGRNPLRL